MDVFVDTNVWIAGLIARGNCAELIEHLIAHHTIWTSSKVRGEIQRVLEGKFSYTEERVAEVLEWHDDVCRLTGPVDAPAEMTRDRDDDFILQAALNTDVEVVVTGDGDLLEVNDEVPVQVVSPSEFWALG